MVKLTSEGQSVVVLLYWITAWSRQAIYYINHALSRLFFQALYLRGVQCIHIQILTGADAPVAPVLNAALHNCFVHSFQILSSMNAAMLTSESLDNIKSDLESAIHLFKIKKYCESAGNFLNIIHRFSEDGQIGQNNCFFLWFVSFHNAPKFLLPQILY